MKFVLELAALLRRVIYVFGDENPSRQDTCALERSILVLTVMTFMIKLAALKGGHGFLRVMMFSSSATPLRILWLKTLYASGPLGV